MPHFETSIATEGAAVDFLALLGRCLGNFKILERVLAMFRDTGGSDLDQLRNAVEQADFSSVVEIAHRFRGAASNVSAISLSKLLFQAEQLGRAREHRELTSVLLDLQTKWTEFVRFAKVFAPPAEVVRSEMSLRMEETVEARHACADC